MSLVVEGTSSLTLIRDSGGLKSEPATLRPEESSKRLTALFAEITLPPDSDNFLQPDQVDYFLGFYSYLVTDALIRPENSTIGTTDLSPFLKAKLELMEPQEFSRELRPLTQSIQWAFDGYKARMGLN